MNPEKETREQRLERLLTESLTRRGWRRHWYLKRECRDDPDLARAVRKLVRTLDENPAFLEQPWAPSPTLREEVDPPAPDTSEYGDLVGHRLGPYTVEQVLGSGGNGVVCRCRRQGLARPVAVKLLRTRLASANDRRRFEREAELLSALSHPGVARVLDFGVEEGPLGPQPYLAMELVEGLPLTDYAESRGLALRPRLELIARVCDSLEHVHQRGIIHRDLKPSNVLVDEAGSPTLLDFGLARVSTPPPASAPTESETRGIVGTLAYLSPEQAQRGPESVDERSDVFATGVLLYEVIAGKPPYDLRESSVLESLRRVAEARVEPLDRVRPELRGDLAAIAHTALARDPDRRYPSAAALGADLRRYLRDQPVLARPPSPWHQLRLLVRRHRILVAALAAVLLSLSTGLILAERARARAAREAEETRAINRFLETAFRSVDSRFDGPRVEFATVLQRAEATIEELFPRRPDLEARVRGLTGSAYTFLGLYPQAERNLRRARELQTRAGLELEAASTGENLALALREAGQLGEAESILMDCLDLHRERFGDDDPSTLRSLGNLAQLRLDQGRPEEAEALARRTLAGQERALAPDADDVGITRSTLTNALLLQQRFDDAAPLIEKQIEAERNRYGDHHPQVLISLSQWALVLERQDRFDEALALYPELLAAMEQEFGPDHPETTRCVSGYAVLLIGLGRREEAAALLRPALEAERRRLAPGHRQIQVTAMNLAGALGPTAEGRALALEAMENLRVRFGPDDADAVLCRSVCRDLLRGSAEPYCSLDTVRHLLSSAAADTGPDPELLFAEEEEVRELLGGEDLAAAELSARLAHARRRRILGDDDPETLLALGWIGIVLCREGRAAPAADALTRAVEGLSAEWESDEPALAELEQYREEAARRAGAYSQSTSSGR